MRLRHLAILSLATFACTSDPKADAGETGETGMVCEDYQGGGPGTLTLNYHNAGDAPVYLSIQACGLPYLPSYIPGHTLVLSAPCDCTCESLMSGEHVAESCECGLDGACGQYSLMRIEPGGTYSPSREVWDFRADVIPAECVAGATSELMCQIAGTLADGDYSLVTQLWAPPACADPNACACAGDESFCEIGVEELGTADEQVEVVMTWMGGAVVDIEL